MFLNKYLLILLLVFSFNLNLISRQQFPNLIPNGNKFSCNTCHTNGGGTPRNAFGLDVKKHLSGNTINWAALSKLDSDGDGYTNGVELQDPEGTWKPGDPQPGNITLVTNPGDKNSVPTTVENEYNRVNNIIDLLTVSPNPINNSFNINFYLNKHKFIEISIYDYDGKLIDKIFNNNLNEGFISLAFDIRKFNKVTTGMYLIGIKTDNILIFDKILVQ